MQGYVDLKDKRFGKLFVIKKVNKPEGSVVSEARWECSCDCGNVKIIKGSKLRSGETKSCGCLRSELLSNRSKTHGMSKTRNYKVWSNMKNRCINVNNPRFNDYGGRGIAVCERWVNSFENFISDMGEPPSAKHSIERINNSLGYSKENCIWVVDSVQARNQRRNVNLTLNGVTKCLTDWANDLGISGTTLYSRIGKLGWPIEKALTTPVIK